jgi:uncharacterized protein (DUF1697 family)
LVYAESLWLPEKFETRLATNYGFDQLVNVRKTGGYRLCAGKASFSNPAAGPASCFEDVTEAAIESRAANTQELGGPAGVLVVKRKSDRDILVLDLGKVPKASVNIRKRNKF